MPAESQFKHFVYGFKSYLNNMGFPEPRGLNMPKIRRSKKLPRILSTVSVVHLLNSCELYSKTLLGVIYDCGLRASEACNLEWTDIDVHRCMVHIRQSKNNKDRVVPISGNTIIVLARYHKEFYTPGFVFKSLNGKDPITTAYIRILFKQGLRLAGLDESLTTHTLRHSYATHLLELGEDIQTVQKRLGHKNITTTMIYLHVAKLERHDCISLLDVIVPARKK